MEFDQSKIRNIAIIAHVDHGKTTLVDSFLKQTHLFRVNQEEMKQEQILDTGDLERERGITITAKNISITYKDHKINIIDTPGHADFGGEVERTLNMADGCLLIVDAQEGPMPQTKFVLKKAFELGLKPMVVINKIDKQYAEPAKVLSKVQDLFLSLATDEDQLEFPVFYTVARDGKAFLNVPDDAEGSKSDMTVLLDGIIEHVSAPEGEKSGAFQMQITSLDYDTHIGRLLIGKINRGSIKVGDKLSILHRTEEGEVKENGVVKNLYMRKGLELEEIKQANTGEIVAIGGIESVAIGGTVCDPGKLEALPIIKISHPSVQIKIDASTSPFSGKEGKFVTSKQIQQRLEKEKDSNISLKITRSDGGAYNVAGRGELQLSILLETMRREGYEFQVRQPEVMITENPEPSLVIDGDVKENTKYEPLEELYIEVPEEYQGVVTASLNARRAELVDMRQENGLSKFDYKITTRNLLGLRNELLSPTKGNLVMSNFLAGYIEYSEPQLQPRKGVLISSHTGTARGYALNQIQERGMLFIKPGTEVYEGMIIGRNKYEEDIEVNPTRERQGSNVRMKRGEITFTDLKAAMPVSLDFALVFLAKDEILEVTPKNLRLRKAHLTQTERKWAKKDKLSEVAKERMGVV